RTGRVRRHQGLGTFVARSRSLSDPGRAGNPLQALVKDGKVAAFGMRVLAVERGKPSEDLCLALRIETEDEVWRLRGLRLLAGKPAVLETSVVPVQLAPALDLRAGQLRGPLHELLSAEYDLAEAYEEQYLEVIASTQEDPGLLELPTGSRVVRI